ncbi:flagellar motor protein MotB [Sulfuricurvum sp.]|uniref:OmpA/MotB family protein n=1 Tax=Sulfuricurvum sp. TaxID=2025608 RepID=UPI00261B2FF9|nr:flagellar motor protein MotB [Sulfuricurvum sp.]MDD2267508.1 OmpA family protein [Sulfuricurvum sp.]MDD2784500.1 OmpA family protein [Sulfuricurvum sp.]
MNNTLLPRKKHHSKEDYWISLSDMMTSLMMLFLLISVIYMIKVQDSVKVPQIYKETTQGLNHALKKEFDQDLNKWGAVIDKDLTVRFQQPDILFATGSSVLTPRFKEILDEFFTRYLKIMMSKQFINNIEEIRIEGYTSSIWEGESDREKAYFKNMTLSQERTRATLEYIMTSDKINLSDDQKEWLMKYFSAIGFSSGHPLSSSGRCVIDGESEDCRLSQRVEFRVRTNIERKVADIVEK